MTRNIKFPALMSQYIGAIIDGQYNEDDISIVALGNMKCTVETVLAAAMQNCSLIFPSIQTDA